LATTFSSPVCLSTLVTSCLAGGQVGQESCKGGREGAEAVLGKLLCQLISSASLLQARRVKTACAASCSSDDSRLQGVLQEPEALR
jgi:hypothetical protein